MNELSNWLVDRITIFRVSDKPDDFGGFEGKKEKLSFDIPARIEEIPGRAGLEIDQTGKTTLVKKRLFLPPDIDIKPNDTIETAQSGSREAYQVIRVDPKRRESKVHHIEAIIGQQNS